MQLCPSARAPRKGNAAFKQRVCSLIPAPARDPALTRDGQAGIADHDVHRALSLFSTSYGCFQLCKA